MCAMSNQDTERFLNIIDDLNKDYLSDNYILVSFDIVNMYTSKYNIISFFNMRETKLPST